MCGYTVVDKVFARQEISRVFRMFVFGWKHKILIKRLLGQCLSCNRKIKSNWYRIESKSVGCCNLIKIIVTA